jgi:ribonuclease HI
MSDLLLGPGLREIAIYGDGSFSCDLLVGAWAAHVPAFGLQLAGVDPGPTIEHFEFYALVEGMGSVMAVDHTTRPLHLRTDSECVMVFLRHLSSRSGLPARKSFDRIRDLYARAIQLIGTRPVRWSRAKTTSPFHRICHRAAHTALRQHVRTLLTTDSKMRLKYEEGRRKGWLRELERLRDRARKVEDQVLACDTRIAELGALRQAPANAVMQLIPGGDGAEL